MTRLLTNQEAGSALGYPEENEGSDYMPRYNMVAVLDLLAPIAST